MESSESIMPDEKMLLELAELYKIFGDTTRIRILFILHEKEMAVNEIAQRLDMTQSAVSHQLRILKTSSLIKFRRDGKSLIYSLSDVHVSLILKLGREHLEDLKQVL